jgi:uncharacterized metal-binding protein
MPSGRVHLRIEMFGLGVCVLGVAYLVWRGAIDRRLGEVFLLSYLFSSLFLSPDLDLRQSSAAKRWGVGRFLWLPYARIFRHRALSHHLFLGPLTRIGYLSAIVLAIAWGIGLLTGHSLHPVTPSWPIIVAVVSGLYLPNQLHSIVDWVWSFRWRR